MGLLGLFQKKDEYADSGVVLDIGTAFVKALIFQVKDDQASIIGVGRAAQKLTDMVGGAVSDIGGVLKNCELALEQAAAQAGYLPTQTIMGIAGELVKGTKTTVTHLREHPKEKIDLPELKDMISSLQHEAFERARKELAVETGHDELDVRLVHAAVVDVRIDGYRISNPLGFQGREVEIGVFNVFAPIIHLGALQTVADDLDLDLLSIVAEPYAVARAQGPDAGNEYSAIYIDIGGGTTDIAVVRNGGLEGTKMFALGGRAFTKRLASVLNTSFSEAEELKLAYSAGTLSDSRETKVQKALADDAEVWLSGVELTLSEFSNPNSSEPGLDHLPSRILLCGGGSALPEISKLLKAKEWAKRLPFPRQPSVHFLQPKDVERVQDETGQLRDPADVTPMGMANLAIDLIGEEPVMEGILAKVAQSLRR